MLEKLTPREAKVLRSRFLENKTLDGVGEDFFVTRDRVRQIENKAMRKLRWHMNALKSKLERNAPKGLFPQDVKPPEDDIVAEFTRDE